MFAVDFKVLHVTSDILELVIVIDSDHGGIEWLVHVSLDLWLILDFVLGAVLDGLGNGD